MAKTKQTSKAKKSKTPALKTRVSRIKKQLLSGDTASIAQGLAELAAETPELADALLGGMVLHERRSDSEVREFAFMPNAAFAKQSAHLAVMIRALLAAPAPSEVAGLRTAVTSLIVSGPIDLAELIAGMPRLRALRLGEGVTGHAALRDSGVRHLRLDQVSNFDLALLRGAPLTQLHLSSNEALTGFEALATLPLESLRADCDLDATHLRETPLERLRVAGQITHLDALPPTLGELSLQLTDDPSAEQLAALQRLPLHTLHLGGALGRLPLHPSVRKLSLAGATLTDLSQLSNPAELPALEQLELYGCDALERIAATKPPPNLQRLRLTYCKGLSDLSALKGTPWWPLLELERCGEVNESPRDAPPLARLTSADISERRTAAWEFESAWQSEAEAALIARLEQESDPELLRSCTKALAAHDAGRDALLQALREGSPPAREATAWAMFGPRRAEALEPLIAGLDELGPVAALVLSRIPGHEAAREALERSCHSPDPHMRRWSAFTLGAIGSPASEAPLAELLDDDHDRVRRAALGALYRIGARDALARAAHDPHPELVSLSRCWLAMPDRAAQPPPSRIEARPERVALSTSKLPDFTKVDCKTVRFLDLGAGKHTLITNDYALPELPQLTHLAILSRKLTNAGIAASLPKLQWLWLSWNKRMRDLDGVEGLSQLRSLIVRNTIVKDLSPLRDLDLAELSASHSRVSDLSPLFGNKQLEMLSVGNTKVASLEGIGALTNLRLLNIGGTRVTDLRPLVELPHLRVLGLSDLERADFTPLVQMRELVDLDFVGTYFDHSEWALFEPRINVLLPSNYARRDPLGHRAITEALAADRGDQSSNFGWTI